MSRPYQYCVTYVTIFPLAYQQCVHPVLSPALIHSCIHYSIFFFIVIFLYFAVFRLVQVFLPVSVFLLVLVFRLVWVFCRVPVFRRDFGTLISHEGFCVFLLANCC